MGWWYSREIGPDHPGAWDPRVAELAAFVADERDLAWRHPVHVEFLADRDFEGEVTVDERDLTDDERADIDLAAGWYRALGLAEGEIDLLAEQNTATAGGVLAFYDPDADRIYVREPDGGSTGATTAADLPPDLRVTLVHELTHALQDQLVDLARYEGPEGDATRAFTLRAVVEGDAQRVERAYVESLPADDREAYVEAMAGKIEAFEDEVSGVPDVLVVLQGAPYGLGASFLEAVIAVEGDAVVDRLLREPPASEEHLMSPLRHLGNDRPIEISPPTVPEGAELLDEGTFGSVTWYLLLASQIDPMVALEAVDGWGGDAYVVYEAEGRACFRMSYRGDDTGETDEMEAALDDWQAALPDGMATVERTGGSILVTSCDPGADADIGVSDRLGDLLSVPVTRSYVLAELARSDLVGGDGGADLDRAGCVAHELVSRLSLDELTAPEAPPAEEMAVHREAAVVACEE